MNKINTWIIRHKKISLLSAVLIGIALGMLVNRNIDRWINSEGLEHDDSVIVEKRNVDTTHYVMPTDEEMQDFQLHHSLTGNTDEAYEAIHYAFEGMPDIEVVKPLLVEVMNQYKIVINNKNTLICSDVLIAMKHRSKVGVTEMEMLKHMYQHGDRNIDFATQLAVSATYLESIK